MSASSDLPPPQLPVIGQQKGNRFSRLNYLLRWFSRWFYLFVFGFIGLSIVGSIVQAFLTELIVAGKLQIPSLERYFLYKLASSYPFYFVLATVCIVALGILGYFSHNHFMKGEKEREVHRVTSIASGVSTVAAGRVVEEKVPVITQQAVKQGLEEAAIIQKAVKQGFQRALKERDTARSETTSSKLPMDIAVLPLPPAVSGLVGREEDQEWLEGCILAGKIVEVSGMGGVGKTTLVADTIQKIVPLFQGGGVAVILANDETNPTIILRQLVEKLVPNAQELLSRPDTRVSQLYEALSYTLNMHHEKGNRILIVIDGVESGFAKNEGLERLCNIFRSTQVSVVMTTREQLSIRLVQERRELEVFTDEAAVDLLTRLLEGFLYRPLSDGERLDAASICKIAGNHAQAIVLLGGYLEHYSHVALATYLQRLRHSPKMVLDLTDRLRPIEAARGVRLTFASSYTQLEESAQHLFTALGALSGRSCSCKAMEALGAVLGQSEDEIQTNLASLIRSKLVLKPSTGPLTTIERIHLHPLVHEFARELLRSSSNFREDTFYEALAVHYAEWVPGISEDVLSDDDANLMAALRWAKTHIAQADVMLVRLIYNLRWYWHGKFQFEEAFEWLEAGCEMMERLGPDWYEQQGELMFAMGAQYQWIGELTEAERCYKKSYRIFGKISSKAGSKAGQGEALSGLATIAQQKGEIAEAQRLYQRSLDMFRKAHDRRGEAGALYRLGFLALRTGHTDDSLRFLQDSLAIRLALGDDQWGEAIIRHSLGTVFQQIGDIEKAQEHYRDGLAICHRISSRRGEGIILKALGDLALQTTGPIEAEDYLTRSHDISREIFDPQSQSVELYSRGFLFRQMGRNEEAWNYYHQSLEIREKTQDKRGKGFTHKGIGDLARRMGNMAAAEEHLNLGLEISRRITDRRNEAVALKALGDWAWQAGDLDTARRYYEECLPIRKDCRDLRGEAITLKALGDLAFYEEDKMTTRSCLDQSLTLFRQVQDQRGEGITLHSLAMLALEEGNKSKAQKYLSQSLDLIGSVQDRQSECTVRYSLALWADMQNDTSQADQYYRESLQIAAEIKAIYILALLQEALGDFCIRRYGQKGKSEGDHSLIEAAKNYRLIGRENDAKKVEERRGGRYNIRDRNRIVRCLIYDMDEGPNGQSIAVPDERRSALRSS
jgi:tetratricopeptide (TPR) repeat protein